MYKIPVSGSNEQFSISILGVEYDFLFQWIGQPMNKWVFNFGSNGHWFLQGMALTEGGNLLEPIEYLNFGFELILGWTGEDTGLNQSNFGTKYNLYVVENGDAT